MESFSKFYKPRFSAINEEKVKNNLLDNAKKSGIEVITSRIKAINNIGDNVQVSDFSYTNKEDVIGFKVNVKLGTKMISFEYDGEKCTLKHSIKDSFEVCDPDYIYQINFIYNIVNNRSYRSGIKNACLNVANQMETIKNKEIVE